MKYLTSAITLLLVFSLSSFAQDKTFTFKAKVHAYGEPLKGATIEVYEVGDLIYETTSKGGGKFEFELKAEREYMVEVSMENLTTKIIWVKTAGTQKLSFNIPTFSFDVVLKKEKPGPHNELSEIPVTLIKYQPEKKEFYMDKDYANTVKSMKKSIKENGLQRR